ncbi:TrkA C-terminal domain-containing protein [Gracilimonas amylolytica]|uniref:TrkA C-terminal domain-containing protein n=1 Tax=Gracilimonas amylolytica TaxID=1749045 RepID=UPI000CD87E40|nr:TrkA C-terminal domain-containing protein [Gracilimonas amylolytica]
MIAIISLLVVISLSILVTRIAAMALIHTGLSKDAARFQARSAFTGTGFTTTESENVVNHPVRRNILMILIFLGSAGVISTISSLILSFISLERIGYVSVEILVLGLGLILLLLLVQSKWIDRKLSYLINLALNRYTTLDVRDYYSLLHLSDNYRVSEIKVEQQDWLADKTLNDLQLHDEGILVLGIKRSNGEYIGAPRGETKIYNDDTVTLYGRAALLESLDNRQKGQSGDKKHAEAVLEQERMWASQ